MEMIGLPMTMFFHILIISIQAKMSGLPMDNLLNIRLDEFAMSFLSHFQKMYSKQFISREKWLQMSHLRTSYAWLFKSIKLESFLYQGNFYPMGCDAVCWHVAQRWQPVITTVYPKSLYVYNNTNQLSDHR